VTGQAAPLLASTESKGWAGSKEKKMEPQNTQNTQTEDAGGRGSLLSGRIISCAQKVLRELGTGFVEKVYARALVHELGKAGLAVSQQHPLTVRYDGVVVGEFAVDLLVEGVVLVELKAAKAIDDIHRAQCLNYLKASGLHLCLLLNFGKPQLEIKRIVLTR
jgi:GxxExxY protein